MYTHMHACIQAYVPTAKNPAAVAAAAAHQAPRGRAIRGESSHIHIHAHTHTCSAAKDPAAAAAHQAARG